MAQQQWEAQRQLRAEASKVAAQTSTQLNAEFRMMEYDIQAEEAIDAQRHVYAQEAGEEVRRPENAPRAFINYLENKLHNQSLESSIQRSDFEAIESDLPSKSTLNSGPSSLHTRIDCRIKNRFCRMKHGDRSISINKR